MYVKQHRGSLFLHSSDGTLAKIFKTRIVTDIIRVAQIDCGLVEQGCSAAFDSFILFFPNKMTLR